MTLRKPRLAVFKFASCDGCQLSLLDAEDDLLAVCDMVDIAHFAEASSDLQEGPYDISLVEGSITTPHDAERIRQIRAQSKFLMTIGACATSGGIQALRNTSDVAEWVQSVYPSPQFIETLATSTPISQHVLVDFELRGCPVNYHQLVVVVVAIAEGRRPRIPQNSVCLECKLRGDRLCGGRARSSLPGASDAIRLRCHLSGLSSRLLWMLRTKQTSQHVIIARPFPQHGSSYGATAAAGEIL